MIIGQVISTSAGEVTILDIQKDYLMQNKEGLSKQTDMQRMMMVKFIGKVEDIMTI